MPRYCSECTYLNPEKVYNDGTFWCDKMGECHYANDLECYRFCQAYSRTYKRSKNMYEYSQSKQYTSSCYITTMLCHILHMEDNNIYLNILREFRNEILQKDIHYLPILASYDIIGPQIAKYLSLDKNKQEIANSLFHNCIIPITEDIQNNEYQKAIKKYIAMTKELASIYSIEYQIKIEDINSMDITKSGHGIYKTKILSI